MNLLILSSHAVLEYDDLRLFTDLGYNTFIPGAYSDPAHPGEDIRPPLDAPYYAELAMLCHEQRVKHAELGQSVEFGIVDWAKADLHHEVIEWADVVMVNCFPDTWLTGQWERIRHKRVIWRTIGQSSPLLEVEMRPYVAQGLEIVRYSPAERRAFEPSFAGEHAMIRFCKYPADFGPWIGDTVAVGNITQNLDYRGDHCGLDFWRKATEGLPTLPAGLGSERLPNGLGNLPYPRMLEYLSHIRAYLYMGTQPASYTLGLMEAMLAGCPVVSIGPRDMWMPALFEGHELASLWDDEPRGAAVSLAVLLEDPTVAAEFSDLTRARARELFSPEAIGPQWQAYLG